VRIAVTGATGYVGGRLVPRLLEQGYDVVAIGRSRRKLASRPWAEHPGMTLAEADVINDSASLENALKGCDVAYYLVHSMLPEHADFEQADKQAAQNFLQAAENAGVKRIIYLGGLGEDHPGLSKHLQSRAEVGRVLGSGTIPVTVFRAAMIMGSGSASFEILRYLVERLPVMITPKWVHTQTQPIAIRNVLTYLIECLTVPETIGAVFDIGGPDILDYADLMQLYSRVAGLPGRVILPVPFFSPGLSSRWIHFITPVAASIARPLAEGLRNPTVCQDNRVRDLIPQTLLSCEESIQLALSCMRENTIETHWTDAGRIPPPEYIYPGDAKWSGGTAYLDRRQMVLQATPEAIWQPIVEIGGERGWYYGNVLWQLRGLMDFFLGGVGFRRGRRNARQLMPGDALDFWRVVEVKQPTQLALIAEMRLPGEALLTFDLTRQDTSEGCRTVVTQTARFVPRGLLGLAYWFLVTPLHNVVFNGMLRGIAKASQHAVCDGPRRIA
jgi:uncharacterized protein YbjT (DUF2867 family)